MFGDRKLGEGGFCNVYLSDMKNHGLVAVKKLKEKDSVSTMRSIYKESMRREARCLKSLLHPNIVKFLGVILDHECFAIVTEFV